MNTSYSSGETEENNETWKLIYPVFRLRLEPEAYGI
jgi:hypothetical protein